MDNPLPMRAGRHILLSATGLLMLGACGENGRFDLDLRENLGAGFSTTAAAERQIAARPRPDSRGVISYPNYQVALAQNGDTVADVAERVGLPPAELARYNGLPLDVRLRRGEVVALPRRVAEPSPATGASSGDPARPAGTLSQPGAVTTTALEDRASDAINRAGSPQTGAEPVRHRVTRGETAFSIARRYNVPVQALAEWNGLGSDVSVREGQYLIIPVASEAPAPVSSAPGAGTVAPTPPSAAEPLPAEDATPEPPEEMPASPDMSQQATASSESDAQLLYPVSGSIVRPFRKGTNDGIDIAAEPGAPVRAAAAGTVAAITRDTDQVPILVLRHPRNLLTVYAGVDQVDLQKGDQVQRGQVIARVRPANPSLLHFEVREGFDSVDPIDYLE